MVAQVIVKADGKNPLVADATYANFYFPAVGCDCLSSKMA